jgi:hypothetical protein
MAQKQAFLLQKCQYVIKIQYTVKLRYPDFDNRISSISERKCVRIAQQNGGQRLRDSKENVPIIR